MKHLSLQALRKHHSFAVFFIISTFIVLSVLGILYAIAHSRVNIYQSSELTFRYPLKDKITFEPQSSSILVGNYLMINVPMSSMNSMEAPAASVPTNLENTELYSKKKFGNSIFYYQNKSSDYNSKEADSSSVELMNAFEPLSSISVTYSKSHQKEAELVMKTFIIPTTNTHPNH